MLNLPLFSFAEKNTSTGENAGTLSPANVFGDEKGKILYGVINSFNKDQMLATLWVLSVAMIITVMAVGVFSHHEHIMKSVLKVLVTLMGLGILVYWGLGGIK